MQSQKKELRPYIVTTIVVIGAILLTLWISNWIENPPEIAPGYKLSREEMMTIIEKHERNWAMWNFRSYTFRVKENGAWSYLDSYVKIKEGEIAEVSCYDQNGEFQDCTARWKGDEYYYGMSLPAPLFGVARELTSSPWGNNCLTINFHPIFGFPNEIISDCPEIFDDDSRYIVTSFFPK